MRRVVPGGRPDWLSPGRCHGTTLSSIRSGTLAQRRQDHAHVGPRGRERLPAPALGRHRRQAGLPRLRLYDLLSCPFSRVAGANFHPVLFIPVATSDAGMRGGGRALSDG